jgi:hypothetical protein
MLVILKALVERDLPPSCTTEDMLGTLEAVLAVCCPCLAILSVHGHSIGGLGT